MTPKNLSFKSENLVVDWISFNSFQDLHFIIILKINLTLFFQGL